MEEKVNWTFREPDLEAIRGGGDSTESGCQTVFIRWCKTCKKDLLDFRSVQSLWNKQWEVKPAGKEIIPGASCLTEIHYVTLCYCPFGGYQNG
jgi:hypothetical protein